MAAWINRADAAPGWLLLAGLMAEPKLKLNSGCRGTTPLRMAVSNNLCSIEVIRALVEVGASDHQAADTAMQLVNAAAERKMKSISERGRARRVRVQEPAAFAAADAAVETSVAVCKFVEGLVNTDPQSGHYCEHIQITEELAWQGLVRRPWAQRSSS